MRRLGPTLYRPIQAGGDTEMAALLLGAARTAAQPVPLDDFAAPDTWKLIASDGARLDTFTEHEVTLGVSRGTVVVTCAPAQNK